MILPTFNSFPNNKFIAFAEDKIAVAKLMILVFDRIKNIVEKGENAVHQYFLLFPPSFQYQKAFSQGC